MIITNEVRKDPSNSSGFTWSAGDCPLEGYTIKRGLGIGGFGEVYFATTEAGKEVAIKRIIRNAQIEVRGTRHCLNLRHPNLVQLYDVRQIDENQAYIVMEYIAGNTLRDVIDAHPNGIPANEAIELFMQLAAGVAYLHSQGIVHRDLKPANVFLDDGFVKIGDYGLSKFISASKKAGHTDSVGTFHYMAPEISRGNYGKEIDIYALGIILYEMLSGRVPFEGQSVQEIIVKHMTASPDMTGFASPYREVIAKALSKDPTQRHSDVDNLVHELGLKTPSAKSYYVNANPVQNDAPKIPPATAYHANHPGAIPPPVPEPFNPVRASASIEEPMAAALFRKLTDIVIWWKGLNNPPVQFILLVALAFLMYRTAGFWSSAAYYTAILYPIYYCLRFLMVGKKPQSSLAQTVALNPQTPHAVNGNAVNTVPKPMSIPPIPMHLSEQMKAQQESPPFPKPIGPPPRLSFKQWQAAQRNALAQRPAVIRWREWTGSAVTSGLICSVLAVLASMFVIGTNKMPIDTFLPLAVWSSAIVWTASVLLMALSKRWESRAEDGMLYRFQQMAVGLAVGLLAWNLDSYLSLPWHEAYQSFMLSSNASPEVIAKHISEHHRVPPTQFFDMGRPLLPAYLSFFALMFGGIRWWRLSDRVRKHRFSLAAVVFAVAITFFFTNLLYFPVHFAVAMAAALAISLQLSSFWSGSQKQNLPESVQVAR